MEIIGLDGEARQGFTHFRCDVCDLAYDISDLGYFTSGMMSRQGIYSVHLIEVCVECVEYIGGDYERM